MSDYKEQVRAAAAALKRGEDANWELARLTFEVCGPLGQMGPSQSGLIPVSRWAEDVAIQSGRRFSATTAKYYREVWDRFGVRHQGDGLLSWSDAYADIRGGTVGERMVEADFKRALTNATPEQKREVLTSLVREPEVLADDETRWAVRSAVNQATIERHPDLALRPEARLVQDSTLERRVFLADIAHKVDDWARELNAVRDFLDWSGDVDQQRRWVTRQALERLIAAATACRDVLPASYVELVDSA